MDITARLEGLGLLQGGLRTRRFLAAAASVAGFFAAARLASVVFHVAAARALGPQEYGRFHLTVALSDALALAATLGLPAAVVRFMSMESGQDWTDAAVSTAFAVFAASAGLLALLALGLRLELASGLRVAPELIGWAMAYAACFGLHTLAFSVVLGRSDFRGRGAAEALLQISGLALFWFMHSRGATGYWAPAASLSAAFVLAAAFSFSRWPVIHWRRPSASEAAALLHYSTLSALGLAATMVTLAAGKVIINYFLGPGEVGVFGAYFTTTIVVGAAASGVVSTVLFPTASTAEGQKWAWERAASLAPALAAAALGLGLAGWLGTSLLGREFSRHPGWLPVFAATGALFILKEFLGQALAARDASGARAGAIGGWLAAGLHVVLGVWAVPRWGGLGAAASLAAGLLAAIAYYWRRAHLWTPRS